MNLTLPVWPIVESQKRYNSNVPYAYHIKWLKMLLATMDKLEYLNSIPSAVECPVLFHKGVSSGNILYSYLGS